MDGPRPSEFDLIFWFWANVMFLPASGFVAAFAFAVTVSRPFPADSLSARIDQLIVAGYSANAAHASPRSSDSEFLRRVTLDLNGTIPSPDEAKAFFTNKSPGKRIVAVKRLLASPNYARRLAEVFDVAFMERRNDGKVPRAAWEEYLRASFAANKAYDQLVREILSADGTDPKSRPAAKFYLDRDFEPNLVTRDLGRIFLGRNLQCAQCHDHPIVDEYKQHHYFGIYAFLNRTYLFPEPAAANAVLAEKADGDVSFVSVFDEKKVQKKTGPQLPSGKSLVEPMLEKGKEYKVAPAKGVRPVPTFSRREQLARLVATADNPFFARTAVNRIWAMMFGRGLIHPLDMDHAGNPPSHPQLLDLLAREFAKHRFDVKWLIREIARSETYQRSSERMPGKDLPSDRYLAAELKALSPEQFAFATIQATGKRDAKPDSTNVVRSFRSVLAAQPGQVEDASAFTLDQTLFLKHGGAIRGLAESKPGNLTERLAAMKDSKAVADELFLNMLTRLPTTEERAEIATLLADSKDRAADIAELVWALLVSAEFRFNH
jgi:hypothetical protein